MEKAKREKLIEAYFYMWVQRDFALIDRIFSPDILYSECYGPEYRGLDEIRMWIEEMTQKQRVLEWTIKRYVHQGDTAAVEWFFKDEVEGAVRGFDGVSLVDFAADGRIAAIREFASKAEHIRPYG